MFSLFNRKTVTIHSVTIPDFGWTKLKDSDSIIQWINPEQSIAVSVNFFDLLPDLPTVSDADILRNFWRSPIAAVNGGLIQVDLLTLHGIPSAKTIFKLPQDPSGMTYLASLTIPFETCSFVIKLQCAEMEPTGMRDAVIANQLMATGELEMGEQGFENWFFDPYDKNHKHGTLMNLSEQEEYDGQFPVHPLTQARRLLKDIEQNLIFGSEIKKLKLFHT